MSDKQDQKKKDGGDKNKKNQRAREDQKERKQQAEAVASDPHQGNPDTTNRSGTKS